MVVLMLCIYYTGKRTKSNAVKIVLLVLGSSFVALICISLAWFIMKGTFNLLSLEFLYYCVIYRWATES
jgi:hypothetical protein